MVTVDKVNKIYGLKKLNSSKLFLKNKEEREKERDFTPTKTRNISKNKYIEKRRVTPDRSNDDSSSFSGFKNKSKNEVINSSYNLICNSLLWIIY